LSFFLPLFRCRSLYQLPKIWCSQITFLLAADDA
jgi:hypothetical protein